jgi:hypothetical protein
MQLTFTVDTTFADGLGSVGNGGGYDAIYFCAIQEMDACRECLECRSCCQKLDKNAWSQPVFSCLNIAHWLKSDRAISRGFSRARSLCFVEYGL